MIDAGTGIGAGRDGRSRRERAPLLADTPLRDPALDRFGLAAFANALALIIDDERTATPLTIAVSAPWGGGKSSVAGMVESLLADRVARRRGDDARLVCWFNAWEHEDASHLGAALAGAVAREANRRRPWWRRALAPLPGAMLGAGERLRRTWIIAGVSLGAGATLLAADPGQGDQLLGASGAPASGLGVLGATAAAMLVFQRVFAGAKSAARFIDDPRSEASRGSMTEVKQQLGALIRDATDDGRLVIFVDDLDRCESARSLEVCRVASQLLAQEGVVTILLADMSPIAASAAARFASGDEDDAMERADDVGRRYLEKIAQLELALPPPDPADMRQVSSAYGKSLRQSSARAEFELTPLTRLRLGLRRKLRARRRRSADRAKPVDSVPQSRWRAIRAIQSVGWWAFGVGIASLLVTAGFDENAPIIGWLSLLFLVGISIGLWSIALRLRHRVRRSRLKRRIEEVKEKGDLSPEQVAAEVISTTRASHARLHAERALISDLVSSSFLDSDEFRAVGRFLADHPSRLPREGKRTFNHAQLLTEIARARQMFGGDPPLKPEHLAKWVVLRERWPAVSRAALLEPGILDSLEEAADVDGLQAELDSRELHLADETALCELLRGAPKLGPMIERLVYFKPADAAPKAPGKSPQPTAGPRPISAF